MRVLRIASDKSRVRLVAGDIRMPVEDALTADDRTGGYILACQAEISGDVVVDA